MNVSRSRIGSLVLSGTAALALAAAGTALGATLQRNGSSVSAVRTATATDFAIHGETYGYTDMPGMSVTVPVPSGEKALLVITFSAEIRCITNSSIPDNGECKVRVLMDGNPVTPGEVYFGSPRDPESPPYGSETHSMQWVAGPSTAGTHTIKVQWDMLADARFFVTERTLTVLRSKA